MNISYDSDQSKKGAKYRQIDSDSDQSKKGAKYRQIETLKLEKMTKTPQKWPKMAKNVLKMSFSDLGVNRKL